MKTGLTDAKIAGLTAPASGQDEHADAIVQGLRIRVGSTGSKTFILRKRVGIRTVNLTLGRYAPPSFGLAQARRRARDVLADLDAGKDPKLTGTAVSAAPTVAELIETYLAAAVRGQKRSAKEIERILARYIIPAIGHRKADSITRADVTRLVDQITTATPGRPKRTTARAAYLQLSAFYTWAMPRLDRLPAHPCRDAGRPPPPKARERVLTDAEIRAFWIACGSLGWPWEQGFKLLLLTAQRRSEVFGAALDEVDGAIWTIPAERAKNGITTIVPLPKSAQTIIEAMPHADGAVFLFPSQGAEGRTASGFTRATERLRERMAEVLEVDSVEPGFTLHDLRRTAATGMQRLGVQLPVVEAVLNHVSGSRSGVAGIYQRHSYAKEKKAALERWAAEVERIAAKTPAPSNVRQMRAGA